MPDLFDRISGLLYNFFIKPSDKNTPPPTDEKKHTPRHPVINPDQLSESPVKTITTSIKRPDKATKHYWWNFEGAPETEAPIFEILQDDRVIDDLNEKLDTDRFPVIEIPSNVMKAMEILNKTDFEYSEICELINHSPGMTGEFIKTLNSALFFRGENISDLKVGLPRLGKDNIKGMLYMYSSKMDFSNNLLFNNLAKGVVEHCYIVALLANHVGQTYFADPEEAFIAGLLHDIGKLGVLKSLTETYELPEEVDFDVTEDLFDGIFPVMHERAGAYLAANWKINENVIFAIRHHHDFPDIEETEENSERYHLATLINLCDTIARILGYGRRIGKVDLFETPAAEILSLTEDRETIEFFENIPRMLAMKAGQE
jgi:putative nucleotidyltransferase with HDIG domain